MIFADITLDGGFAITDSNQKEGSGGKRKLPSTSRPLSTHDLSPMNSCSLPLASTPPDFFLESTNLYDSHDLNISFACTSI